MKTFRILLINLCYCLGLTGSLANYSLRSYRFLYCSKKIQKNVLEKIKRIIAKTNPDLCCFIEIDQGSKFSNRLNQIEKLTNSLYPFHSIENKYGKISKILPIPYLRKQSNGFISKQNFPFKKHYFKRGTKKLIYEIQLNSKTFLFMAHFALNKKIRTKQFKDMRNIIKNKNKVIICGDFNIKRSDELEELTADTDLKLVNRLRDKTFPSHNPKRMLDLFLCSKNINVGKNRVLRGAKFSDHLPVLLEIKI